MRKARIAPATLVRLFYDFCLAQSGFSRTCARRARSMLEVRRRLDESFDASFKCR
jgi:hypothetical protein